MAKVHPINVRALAEFALQRGDLSMAAADRMNEGAQIHRRLQSALGEGWVAEEYVSREVPVGKVALRVQGRADAVRHADGRVEVLEIKSTARDPRLIGPDDWPAHFAQGQIYAYLICENEGLPGAEVTLCYVGAAGGEVRYRRESTRAELEEVFLRCAVPYAEWMAALDEWREQSVPTLESLKFPFERYRDGQRAMAAQVYRAMRDGGRALIEAPTGIGKTAAALFGALKALGRGCVTAIFYLTARTTGRRAAEQALDRMRTQGLKLRSIAITAKDKCCPMPRRECFGCPLAADYYERRRPALREALAIEAATAEAVRALAEEYELCPYELSLDMSEQADVVICDYNYAFDPRVRLRRYFDQKSKAGLLIDEAHNLPDRAREMFSAELSGKKVAAARREVGRYEGRQSPTWQALTDLLAALTQPEVEPEASEAPPEAIVRAAQLFADRAGQLQSPEPQVNELMLDALWFVRTAGRFDPQRDRALILPEGKRIAARLWCFDPSEHLKKALRRVGGAALFSATLAPMDHYARQLGLDRDDATLRLPSPFPPENQLTVRLPVSVRFSDRERTLEAVVRIIRAMARAHAGNYLACFPSFAYLDMAFERYRLLFPDDVAVRQTPRMDEAARAAFIAQFDAHPARGMVAFVVLGGVFAEGVDLPDDRLSGAAIVSTGIPQIGFERNLMAELFDDGFGAGGDVAYTYPGIRRVLQAAGRVIRTETDRGVVLLIDMRYGDPHIRQLLPEHWQLERAKRLDALEARLKDFWSAEKTMEI